MVVVLASACVTTRDRGNADFEGRAATYKAPLEQRCDKYKSGGGRAAACAEAKYLAEIYVRRLAAPDEVCLEGGFGDQPTGACLARAAVVDSATNRALIEIRQAKPESKWFNHEQHQFWFEEGALVDLYLAEHGY
jgi:hypothetical protein